MEKNVIHKIITKGFDDLESNIKPNLSSFRGSKIVIRHYMKY
jgi:hypothetical protein